MKAILGFTRMSVRGLNKVKRELGFVLMALNIRKVVAQRAENNQKFIKRQFLYYFNRNCLFSLSRTLCPGLFLIIIYIIGDYQKLWHKIRGFCCKIKNHVIFILKNEK